MAVSPVSKVKLVVVSADGTKMVLTPAEFARMRLLPGMKVGVLDETTGQAPKGLTAKTQGKDLVLELPEHGLLAKVEGFEELTDFSFVEDINAITTAQSTGVVYAQAASAAPVATDAGAAAVKATPASTSSGGISLPMIGLALGGLALAAGGGGGSSSTPAPETPAAPFTVTEVAGIVTFGGAATGDITLTIGNNAVVTFARGGNTASVSVSDLTNNTIHLAAGQTLKMTLAQAQAVEGLVITGAGHVLIDGTALSSSSAVTTQVLIKANLTGGNITFDLPSDDNDEIVLEAGSYIRLNNSGNLVVSDGTVDATFATLSGISEIVVNSGLRITSSQLSALSGVKVVTNSDATPGRLDVVVKSADDVIALENIIGNLFVVSPILTITPRNDSPEVLQQIQQQVVESAPALNAVLEQKKAEAYTPNNEIVVNPSESNEGVPVTFTVNYEPGDVTFGGTASGDITMALNATGDAVFSRGGVNVASAVPTTIADGTVQTVINVETGTTINAVLSGTAGSNTFILNAPNAAAFVLSGNTGTGLDEVVISVLDPDTSTQVAPDNQGKVDVRTLKIDTSALQGSAGDRLVFDFVGAEDLVVITADSDFSGFSTIEVRDGTVDVHNVAIPSNIAFIVNSGLTVSVDQLLAMESLASVTGLGRLTIIADDADQLDGIAAQIADKIESNAAFLIGFAAAEPGYIEVKVGSTVVASNQLGVTVPGNAVDPDGVSLMNALSGGSLPSIPALAGLVAGLQSQITILQSTGSNSITTVANNLTTLQGVVSALDAAYKVGDVSLDTRLDAAEAALAGITTTVNAAIGTAITNLHTSLKGAGFDAATDLATFKAISDAIEIITGGNTTTGSISKAVLDSYTTLTNEYNAAIGTAITNLHTSLKGAGFDAATDLATFKAISDAIEIITGGNTTTGSISKAVLDSYTTLTNEYNAAIGTAITNLHTSLKGAGFDAATDLATFKAISDAIEIITGGNTTTGSISKAVLDSYTTLTNEYNAAIGTAITNLHTSLKGAGFDAATDLATFKAISDAIEIITGGNTTTGSISKAVLDSYTTLTNEYNAAIGTAITNLHTSLKGAGFDAATDLATFKAISDAIEIITGGNTTTGSISKAVLDSYTTLTNEYNAAIGTAITNLHTSLKGAGFDAATDLATFKAISDAIEIITGGNTTTGSISKAVLDSYTTLTNEYNAAIGTAITNLHTSLKGAGFDAATDLATFKAISDAIEIITGGNTTTGSISKAVLDSYTTLTNEYNAAIGTAITNLHTSLKGAGFDAATDLATFKAISDAIEIITGGNTTTGSISKAVLDSYTTLTNEYNAAIGTAITNLHTSLKGAGFDAATDLATFKAISDAIEIITGGNTTTGSISKAVLDSYTTLTNEYTNAIKVVSLVPTLMVFGGDLADNVLESQEGSFTVRVNLSQVTVSTDTVQLYLDGDTFGTAYTVQSSDITAGFKDFVIAQADLGDPGSKAITAKVISDSITSNSSAGLYFTYSPDTLSPSAIATITDISADTGTSDTDYITNQSIQTVTGTLSAPLAAGEKVQVTADGTNWFDATVGGTLWFAPALLSSANSGAGTITVRTIDAAGNVTNGDSTHGTKSYVLDTTAPDTPTITGVGLTNDSTPTLTFNTTAGAFVSVIINGSVVSQGVASGGVYTFTPSAALTDGNYSVTARASDLAGNLSGLAQVQTLTIDSTAPAAPTITSAALTNDATPVITGTAEAGSAVNVVVAGATYTVTATGGTWSVDTTPTTGTPVASGTLAINANGNNSVSVTAKDAANNTSAASTQTLVIDTTLPTVTITDNKTSSTNGEITYTITFSEAVSGFTQSDVTVTNGTIRLFNKSSDSVYQMVVTPDVNEAGNITVDISANVAVDAAGNGNSAATQNVQAFDTAAPAAPTINTVATDDIVDALENAQGFTISGTGETGATVTVVLSSGHTLAGGNTAVVVDGEWSIAVAANEAGQFFKLGDELITVYQTDAVGNTSAESKKLIDVITTVVAGGDLSGQTYSGVSKLELNANSTLPTNQNGLPLTIDAKGYDITIAGDLDLRDVTITNVKNLAIADTVTATLTVSQASTFNNAGSINLNNSGVVSVTASGNLSAFDLENVSLILSGAATLPSSTAAMPKAIDANSNTITIADTVNVTGVALTEIATITVAVTGDLTINASQVSGKAVNGLGAVVVASLGANTDLTSVNPGSGVTATVTSNLDVTGNANLANVDYFQVANTFTLSATAAQVSGRMVVGQGGVEVVGLASDTNLSGVNPGAGVTVVVLDSVDVTANTNLTNVDIYSVESTKTLTANASQLTGKTVDGAGAVSVQALAADSNLSNVNPAGGVSARVSSSIDITANSNLGTIDSFSVDGSRTLTATAAQMTGLIASGAGTVAVTALDDTTNADLSLLESTVVTAAATVSNETVNFTGKFGIAQVSITGVVDGNADIFNVDSAVMGTATFSTGSGVTLQGTAEKLSGVTVTGHGQVQISALQSTPSADLSLMTLTSVVATAALSDQTVNFTGKFGKAVVTITGTSGGAEDLFEIGAAADMGTASFKVGTDAVLAGSASMLSGKTINAVGVGNAGTVEILGLGTDTNLSGVASALSLVAIADSDVDVSANSNLANVDEFAVSAGNTLTLSATQATKVVQLENTAVALVKVAASTDISALTIDSDVSGFVVDAGVTLTALSAQLAGKTFSGTGTVALTDQPTLAQLVEINNATSGAITLDVTSGALSGTASDLAAAFAGTITTYTGAVEITDAQSGAAGVTAVNAIAAKTSGVVTATVSGTVSELNSLTETGNAYAITVTDTATVAQLTAIDGVTTGTLTYTSITDAALNVAAADGTGLSSYVTGAVNVTLNTAATVAQLTTIDGVTTGTLTYTSITDAAVNVAAADGTGLSSYVTGAVNVTLSDQPTLAQLVEINNATSGAITLDVTSGALSGTASDLAAAFAGTITTYTGAVEITDAQSGAAGVTAVNAIAAKTSGVVTATVSGTVSELNSLTETGNAYAITVTDTATVAQLTAIDGVTTGALTGTSITDAALNVAAADGTGLSSYVTGAVNVTLSDQPTLAQLVEINNATSGAITLDVTSGALSGTASDLAAAFAGTITTYTGAVEITDAQSGAAGVTAVNAIAAKTSGVVTATVSGTVSELNSLTETGNAYAITVTDTATVAQLTAIDGVTTGTLTYTSITDAALNVAAADGTGLSSYVTGAVNVTLSDQPTLAQLVEINNATSGAITLDVTSGALSGTASDLAAAFAGTITTYTGAVEITDAQSGAAGVTAVNAIAAKTSGVVTATVSGTVSELNSLTETGNAYAITVTDTATVAQLTAIDGVTTGALTGTSITDAALNVAAADGTGLSSYVTGAVNVTLNTAATVAQLTTIDGVTTGTLTYTSITDAAVNVAAADGTGLSSYVTGAVNVTLSDQPTLAQLVEINNATSGAITLDVTSGALSGTASDLAAAFAGTITTYTGAVEITDAQSGAAGVTAVNAIAAKTSGVVTATVSGTVSELNSLTETGNAYAITVTDTATVAQLTAIDGVTTGTLTYTSITDAALNVAAADGTGLSSYVTGAVNVTLNTAATVAQLTTIDGVTTGTLTYTSITDAAVNVAAADGTGLSSYVTGAVNVTLSDQPTLAQLVEINNATSGAITLDVTSGALSGTASDLAAAFAGTITTYTGAVEITDAQSGAAGVTAVNAIAAKTSGVVTATVSGTVSELNSLTETGNAYAITVTDTATVAQLTAIDGVTTGTLTYTSITDAALNVAAADGTGLSSYVTGAVNVTLSDQPTLAQLVEINNATSGAITLDVTSGALSGTASDLAAAFAGTITTYTGAVEITDAQSGAAGVTAVNAIAAKTSGVVTATVSGTVSELNSLTETGNAYAITVTDTATVAQLTAIDGVTTGALTGTSITDAALNVAAADGTGLSSYVTGAVNVTLNTAATVAQLNAIDAANGSGEITATVSDGTVSTLKTLTGTHAYTITITDTGTLGSPIRIADLLAIDTATSVAVTADAITNLAGSGASLDTLATAYANGTITDVSGFTFEVNNGAAMTSATVTQLNAIDAVNGNGQIYAQVYDTVANLLTLTGTHAYYAQVTTTTSADAADLITIDAATSSYSFNAANITTITGSVADLKTIVAASTITTASNYAAVITDATVSVADVNTVAGDTLGVVTATLTTGNLASFSSLNTASTDLITVNVSDAGGSTLAATDLSTLGGKTAGVVTVQNAVTISGTSAELMAALVTAETKVIAATANITFTDAPSLAQFAAIDAVTSGTLNYTSIADTAANLVADAAATTAAVAYNKPITVTNSGTVQAADLVTISANTTQTVTATAATTISGSASNLVSVVNDAGIATAANYNADITGTASTAQISLIDGDTSGTVSVEKISDTLGNIASFNTTSATIVQNASGTVTAAGDGNNDSANFSTVGRSMVILGMGGNDSLTGTEFADDITGGTGADSLFGKGGADVFRFATGDSPTALVASLIFDKIGDFDSTLDKVDFTSVAPVLGTADANASATLGGATGTVSVDQFGKVTFSATPIDLMEALSAVRSIVTGAGEVAFFQFNDGFNGEGTFLYQDAGSASTTNDMLIFLADVTGIDDISHAGGDNNTLFIV